MADQMLNDKDYDLISVIYNASQAAETCRQYLNDAKKEGDSEAERFFNEVIETNISMINRGKSLLKTRLQ